MVNNRSNVIPQKEISKVKGNISDKKITYNECIDIINKLKFNNDIKIVFC